MQFPKIMEKADIEVYNHMMTMDENVIWTKSIDLLSNFSLRAFLYIYIYFNIINSLFICTH